MPLTGYARSLVRRNGGIQRLYLIEASSLVAATLDPSLGGYTSLTLLAEHHFAEYQFREGSGAYRTTLSRTESSVAVSHQIDVGFSPLHSQTNACLSELAATAEMIALVELRTGERLLVGYSEHFAATRPLTLSHAEGDSAAAGDTPSTLSLSLRSQDTSAALPFVGELTPLLRP